MQALDLEIGLLSDWNAEAVRGFGVAQEFRGPKEVAERTAYRLWLLGDQLEHGRAPWLDPYSFRPESSARVNPSAWPFGLPYWPLSAVLGRVWAWNAFVLLTFLLSGAAASAWLRELELPR